MWLVKALNKPDDSAEILCVPAALASVSVRIIVRSLHGSPTIITLHFVCEIPSSNKTNFVFKDSVLTLVYISQRDHRQTYQYLQSSIHL